MGGQEINSEQTGCMGPPCRENVHLKRSVEHAALSTHSQWVGKAVSTGLKKRPEALGKSLTTSFPKADHSSSF